MPLRNLVSLCMVNLVSLQTKVLKAGFACQILKKFYLLHQKPNSKRPTTRFGNGLIPGSPDKYFSFMLHCYSGLCLRSAPNISKINFSSIRKSNACWHGFGINNTILLDIGSEEVEFMSTSF